MTPSRAKGLAGWMPWCWWCGAMLACGSPPCSLTWCLGWEMGVGDVSTSRTKCRNGVHQCSTNVVASQRTPQREMALPDFAVGGKRFFDVYLVVWVPGNMCVCGCVFVWPRAMTMRWQRQFQTDRVSVQCDGMLCDFQTYPPSCYKLNYCVLVCGWLAGWLVWPQGYRACEKIIYLYIDMMQCQDDVCAAGFAVVLWSFRVADSPSVICLRVRF